MPIGLLHGAAPGIDRADRAAGRVGALLASLGILLLVDFSCFQIEELRVADILQHQRFRTIANDDQLAFADLQLGHGTSLLSHETPNPGIQLLAASSLRAMM